MTTIATKFFRVNCAIVALFAHCGVIGGEISNEAKEPVQPVIEPAVSAINGKVDGHYGEINGSSTRGVAGSLSVPLGERYGFQFDTLIEHGMDSDLYGGGGHLFTRQPDKGLLGFAFGFSESTDYTDIIAGVEAERYLCNVTLGAFVGYNTFDTHLTPFFDPSIADQTDYLAGRLYAAIYPTDDLMIRLEYQNRVDLNFFIANVEYQTQIKGLALFADAGFGENDYSHLIGGIRLYFGGGCKSLKDRHRKDDPDNILTVFTRTGMGAGSNPGFTPSVPSTPPPIPD